MKGQEKGRHKASPYNKIRYILKILRIRVLTFFRSLAHQHIKKSAHYLIVFIKRIQRFVDVIVFEGEALFGYFVGANSGTVKHYFAHFA